MGVWDTLLHDDFSLAIGVTGTEPLAENMAVYPLGGDLALRDVAASPAKPANRPAIRGSIAALSGGEY